MFGFHYFCYWTITCMFNLKTIYAGLLELRMKIILKPSEYNVLKKMY